MQQPLDLFTAFTVISRVRMVIKTPTLNINKNGKPLVKIIIDEQKMWLDAPAWEFVGIVVIVLESIKPTND